MAPSPHALQPLRSWRSLLRSFHRKQHQTRAISAATLRYRTPPAPLPPPDQLPAGMTYAEYKDIPRAPHKIKIYPPPATAVKRCPEPLHTFNLSQISTLDPTGSRTRFLSPSNPDAARVGDVLLVRFRSGDPFAGVCLSIRQRGPDTAVLLRNHLTRVGTEMWVKVYSPLVMGMELVQRKEIRARRARLYYMRKPKHDRGPLESLVEQYVRNKRATGRGLVGGGGAGKKDRKKKAGAKEVAKVGTRKQIKV
ncbi:MAG: hypothetical protein MMC23_007866 [Stictis urceolatum]|nr:hypothetical protein [Stictis urceolata]